MEYAETHKKKAYSILSLIVGLTALLIFNYWFVYKAKMELTGVGIASSMGLFFQMLTIIALNYRTLGDDGKVLLFGQETYVNLCG